MGGGLLQEVSSYTIHSSPLRADSKERIIRKKIMYN